MRKKITLSVAIACLGISTMVAQTQRTILYEEFTGENCGPCAQTNPGVTSTIHATGNFPTKILLVRYQCNIPTAPGPGSLYADNISEEQVRQTYYSVPFAPYARFNGDVLPWPSQASDNGHAALIDPAAGINPTIIADSSIVNAPFGITATHSFNAAADSVTVSVTVTAAMAYNSMSAGSLVLQVALEEAAVHFTAPPGSNGEKDFYDIMRKMVPNSSGTALNNAWTNGATQTITQKIKVPTYIHDKSQICFVAWVQENGSKRVHNAAYSAPMAFVNDASASAIGSVPAIQCTTTLNPVATILNVGSATMTSCTVTYKVDAGTPSTTPWSGSITTGSTATVSIPAITTTPGTHTLYVSTSMPNGNTDVNPNNDQTKYIYIIVGAPVNAPVVEPFTAATFPPANWSVNDIDHDGITWVHGSATGSSSGAGATNLDCYDSPPGNMDELYLPYNSLGNTPALTFYVASAPYTAGSPEPDELDFMISTDCGTTWTTLYSKTGANLNTAAANQNPFTPASAADWRMETVNISAFANTPNLLMKFVGTSGYGNFIWVDDVNLTGATGIKQNTSNVAFSTVYPNPAGNSTTILASMTQEENAKIIVMNMIGETIYTDTKALAVGDNHININTSNFANGVYTVVISTVSGSVTHKLTVSK